MHHYKFLIYFRKVIFYYFFSSMKKSQLFASLAKYQVMFLRLILLFVLFAHWRTKISWWMERRTGLWGAMWVYGIDFFPAFWWFMAAYAESIWVVLIAAWLFTRYNAFFLAFTMLTAIMTKVTGDPGIEKLGDLSAAVFIFATAFSLFLSGWWSIFNLEKKLFWKEY